MKALRQFALVLMIVLPLLSPAMACVLPSAHMTTAERACCTHMRAQCGAANMPASHGCCHKDLPASARLNMVPANTAYLHAVAHVAASIPVAIFQLPNAKPALRSAKWRDPGPPQSPPAAISVLKI